MPKSRYHRESGKRNKKVVMYYPTKRSAYKARAKMKNVQKSNLKTRPYNISRVQKTHGHGYKISYKRRRI